MGCNNALLTRYRVRIREENAGLGGQAFDPLGLIVQKNIISVTGLSLGELGRISLLEYDKVVEIPDGRRRIPPLGMALRLDGSAGSLAQQLFFEQWWDDRSNITRTIIVDITKRDWSLLFRFEFLGCMINSFSFPDQDLGAPQLGVIQMGFSPYDVRLKRDVVSAIESNIAIG